jgi:hypothetical protein
VWWHWFNKGRYKGRVVSDTEARLIRIEDKVDKFADAFISLAAVEQKILYTIERVEALEREVRRDDQRMQEMSEKSAVREKTVGQGERAFWVLVTASLTVVLAWIMDGHV